MKKIFFLCLGLFTLLSLVHSQEIQPGSKPNKTQKDLIKRAYGMFMHFGVNTFSGDEWSDGTLSPAIYNPKELDCDQWVRVARDAGFRYVLLTTKHHDGFCLWDSKYTTYDVASSPVKTDVVRKVAEACKKYGLKFAIYYSLWDRHEPTFKDKDPNKYIDFMINQLNELLSNYGDICELWFDGEWARKVKDWDIPRLYKFIKQKQPNCAVGINHTIVYEEGKRNYALPSLMTEDNKYYIQCFPGDFRLWDPKIASKKDKKQYLNKGKSYYLPFEHTICLSKAWNWFQKGTPQPVRDLDELEELFYWCTDNNNTLVIDVPPAPSGKIRENEANAVIGLRKRLNIKKNKPLPKNGTFISLDSKVSATSTYHKNNQIYKAKYAVDGGMQTRWKANENTAKLTLNLNPKDAFNKISIFEYCDTKQSNDGFSNERVNRIKSYQINILQNNHWKTIYMDNEPMGDCKVIKFPNSYMGVSKIQLEILKAKNRPSIKEFCVINMNNKRK